MNATKKELLSIAALQRHHLTTHTLSVISAGRNRWKGRVLRIRAAEGNFILKDVSNMAELPRLLVGRRQLRHEAGILARIATIEAAPRFIRWLDAESFFMEDVQGCPLKEWGERALPGHSSANWSKPWEPCTPSEWSMVIPMRETYWCPRTGVRGSSTSGLPWR